jgi:hypothetical protein
MALLSSAAWMAHDVGLATSIGGTMFGREALQPALSEISDHKQRDQVSAVAWRRFSWINMAGHAVVAATWFAGRSMMSGRSVSRSARTLTLVKDGLIVASLATGITSMILGRVLGGRTGATNGHASHTAGGKQAGANTNASTSTSTSDSHETTDRLRRAVSTLGMVNLATNLGIAGVTTALSMEASRSLPFSVLSRRLP